METAQADVVWSGRIAAIPVTTLHLMQLEVCDHQSSRCPSACWFDPFGVETIQL